MQAIKLCDIAQATYRCLFRSSIATERQLLALISQVLEVTELIQKLILQQFQSLSPSKASIAMEEIKLPSQLLEQSFLHSSTITDTSIGLKRISRKTDQSSATRRSLSKHSSSKSNEKTSTTSFFVKMSTLQKISQENSTTAARSSIMRRQGSINEKKRSPTPVPGILVRRKASEQEARKEDVEIQNELLIAELQSKLNEENQKVRIFQKKAFLLEKQLKCKLAKIEDLEKTVGKALQKEKQLIARLKDFQRQIPSDQMTLEPKSKLERFKNNIKLNRLAELQSENNRLRKENEELKVKISILEEESKQSEQHSTLLQSQLRAMKHQVAQEKKEIVISPRNKNFQDMLLSREEYNMKLEARVSKLEIQLNYMNRKKMEEIQQWKDKKNKEVVRVRERLASMHKQFIQLRKENDRLRKGIRKQDVTLSRSSLITTTHSCSSREDIIELSLSPEHFEY